ncbi:MAG TPA: N-acetylmuramoyl-L-alanine amidase [Bacteroidetes bacterium]|nr:N-acetylmuramoyl-L-alanine amidase [Bacteroidota bacterium]
MKVPASNILNIYFSNSQQKIFFIVLAILLFPPWIKAQDNNKAVYKIKKVVIDPGHGGKDPGTLGQHSREKNIVLSIALKLGKYIEDNVKDVQIIYTRKKDVFVELHERGNIANTNHADLFISIHCNSSLNKNIYGAETYVMGLNVGERNMEVARKENAVITLENDYSQHYEGFDPNSPESYIVFNLMQNTYLEQSLEFATLVQKQFKDRAGRHDHGVRQAGFLVLWKTSMPSVLIETGYLSNPKEEKFLMSDNGQALIASAIYRAFKNYKTMIESQSNFTVARADTNQSFFSVQVLTSRKKIPLDDKTFKKYKPVFEFKEGSRYKYTVGRSSSYEEIKNLRKQLLTDFPDAFLVAVKDYRIISLQEALKKMK